MNYKKIIKICLFALIFQSFLFSVVLAADVKFTPSVGIPGVSDQEVIVRSDFSTLTDYIAKFYKFAIGLTGILAVIMVTAGGMVWLTAGGSSTQIGKAKQMILGSIAGLLLALFSYTLLYSINPDIVSMKIAMVNSIPGKSMEGCDWQTTECNSVSQKEADYGNYCGSKPTIEGVVDPEMEYCCCKKEGYNPGCCITYNDISNRTKDNIYSCRITMNENDCAVRGSTIDDYTNFVESDCADVDGCSEDDDFCRFDKPETEEKSCGTNKICWGGKCTECAGKDEQCTDEPGWGYGKPCCAGVEYCKVLHHPYMHCTE